MTEAQYKLAKDQERDKTVKADKKRIDEALSSNDKTKLTETHIYIDGKYGAYIPEWGMGVYGYILKHGFHYEHLDKPSLAHNLQMMRAKIEGYAMGFEKSHEGAYTSNNNVNVNVSNTNEMNVSISFDDARQKVEDMTSLTAEETNEILDKISELEEIINGKDKKKTKWEKAKPVLVWLADKSFDVGMALLPLLLNI